jgi:peptide/nickel transport system ATP-binding protein
MRVNEHRSAVRNAVSDASTLLQDSFSSPLLSVSDLKVWFGESDRPVRAVDGVDLTLHRGKTFALLGESGCGKSMTALSILRLLPPGGRIVSGHIRLDGQDLLGLTEPAMQEIRGGRIAMIFQEPQTSLNPVLPVGVQIGEALIRHRKLQGDTVREEVLSLLDAVGIPDRARRYDEYPHQLSGGMKQRVMVAMALAGRPDLLIADEPTTALDVTIQAQVLELLKQLQRDMGMAILLITHDLGVVAGMADEVSVMYAGHIVEHSDRETFFKAPAHPYSRKLFDSLPTSAKRGHELSVIRGSVPALTQVFPACRFEARCDHAWELCRKVPPRWIEPNPRQGVRCHLHDPEVHKEMPLPPVRGKVGMGVESVGGHIQSLPPSYPSPCKGEGIETGRHIGLPLLAAEGIKVHFPIHAGIFRRVVGHVRAVDGVSLRIDRGTTLALVGESGCGKTTVGKGLLRLIPLTEGAIRFDGADFTRLKAQDLRRKRAEVQFIFQDPYSSMNPRMRVGEIVEEGLIAQKLGENRKVRQERVDELLRQVGLSPEIKYRYPHEFSGGQRQRICIARALAVHPRLVVCDEPTSALDVSVQAQILNLLKDLQDRLGLAYLFITHNISVVEYLAQRVAVMYLGRIVEQGTVDEILNTPKHPYTQALLSAVPVVDEADRRRQVIRLAGELPSPANPPQGCHFHPRCPHAMPQCRLAYPGAASFSDTHTARCYLYTPLHEDTAHPRT